MRGAVEEGHVDAEFGYHCAETIEGDPIYYVGLQKVRSSYTFDEFN